MNSIKLQDIRLIQKSYMFLHTNNALSERERKKTILFTIVSIRIGIHLTKEGKDLCLGNCKILMKEIEDSLKNGKLQCTHKL